MFSMSYAFLIHRQAKETKWSEYFWIFTSSLFFGSGSLKGLWTTKFLGIDLTLLTFCLFIIHSIVIVLKNLQVIKSLNYSGLVVLLPFTLLVFYSMLFSNGIGDFEIVSNYYPNVKFRNLMLINIPAAILFSLVLSVRRHINLAYYVFVLVSAAVSIGLILSPNNRIDGIRLGIGSDTITPGYLMVFGIFALWSLHLKVKINPILLSVLSLYLSLSIIRTGSRGPFISLLIAFCLILIRYKGIKRLLPLLVMALSAIFIRVSGIAPEIQNRLAFANIFVDKGRTALAEAALSNISENPLFGIGFGKFGERTGYFLQEYAHNIFLEIFLELGFIGLVSFLAILIVYFVKCASQGLDKNFLRGLGVLALTSGMFSGDMTNRNIWFILCIGLLTHAQEGRSAKTLLVS
jgi:O-antigen ligase